MYTPPPSPKTHHHSLEQLHQFVHASCNKIRHSHEGDVGPISSEVQLQVSERHLEKKKKEKKGEKKRQICKCKLILVCLIELWVQNHDANKVVPVDVASKFPDWNNATTRNKRIFKSRRTLINNNTERKKSSAHTKKYKTNVKLFPYLELLQMPAFLFKDFLFLCLTNVKCTAIGCHRVQSWWKACRSAIRTTE